MIRVELSPKDFTELRFAFSSLWECVASLRVFDDPPRHALHAPWLRSVSPKMRTLEMPLTRSLLRNPRRYVPDFLVPPPSRPTVRFDDEVRMMLATPGAVVGRETIGAFGDAALLPPLLRARLEQPKEMLSALAAELRAYWKVAIRPYWNRIENTLEADLLYRARVLAVGGANALFANLHSTVRWTKNRLEIRRGEREERWKRGAGLVLVPSVFAWPDVYVGAAPPWKPTISYPARGVGSIWGETRPSRTNLASTILGQTRAKVFESLEQSATTASLAARLGLTAGAISQQVRMLWTAGLLDRTRSGQRVYYTLNAHGLRILDALRSPTMSHGPGASEELLI
jgi:DNA-binding transcriptional ArsR family regulator